MFFENIVLTVLIWALIAVVGLLVSWIVFHLLSWLVLIIFSITINYKKDYMTSNKFWRACLNYAYWLLISFSRTKVHVSGIEKIPTDVRFMYIANHRSKFDHMILSFMIRPAPLAFISKKENFKIPFVNRLIKRCCYLSLDRGNARSSVETIFKSAELIKNGECSIGVFPEGTRSKDAKLQEFMPGCFKIATSSKCPIVVCSLQNTEKIHRNFPWKTTHVNLDVLEVLTPEMLAGKKTVEISSLCHSIIKAKLEPEV